MRRSTRPRPLPFVAILTATSTTFAPIACSRSGLDLEETPAALPSSTGLGADASAGPRTPEDAGLHVSPPDADAGDATTPPDAQGRDAGLTSDGSTDPPGTFASALQINPSHDGTIDDPLLAGPLTRLWSVQLPAPISYPIIARDIIVVATSQWGDGAQAQLFAFHAHTGAPVWGPIDLGTGGPLSASASFGAATYENGRVFTEESDGVVRAFDITTGTPLWTTSWPTVPGAELNSAPTAYDGVVYIDVGGLQAVDESSGALLWETKGSDELTGGSDPAITPDGIFVSHACAVTSRSDLLNGASLWESWAIGCSSGGGAWTPVVSGGLVYARQEDDVTTNILTPPYILDVATGADAGTFLSGSPPAVHGGHLFVVSHGVLSSVDLHGQNPAWSFGDGKLVTPPIVVSGSVFIGASDGMLYRLDEATGHEVWSDDAGEGFGELQDGFGEQPALAAAGGVLVAPAGDTLVVYGAGGDAGSGGAGGD